MIQLQALVPSSQTNSKQEFIIRDHSSIGKKKKKIKEIATASNNVELNDNTNKNVPSINDLTDCITSSAPTEFYESKKKKLKKKKLAEIQPPKTGID